jgi:glucose/arabinose dehydrogenase
MILRIPFLKKTLLIVAGMAASHFLSAQTGEKIYANYCSGCHGSKLQGSAATPLVKTNWKHGGDRKSIINSISNGIPGTEMAKWEGILSAKDIEAVTDFILAAQKKPVQKTSVSLPLVIPTKDYQLKIEKLITSGLDTPWGIEFVNEKRALISQRSGQLSWMINGKLDTKPITGTPVTYAQGVTGGYMDIALDPDYSKNGWVYLAYSENSINSQDENTPGMTKVIRGKIVDYKWRDEQVLFQVADSLKLSKGVRWGGRFLFDKQGHLYFSIGDMGRGADSQVLSRPSGKVYRIHADGSIPKDNPLYGKEDVLQAIYSWGNRNVQGITQHPVSGVIYASEHGPKGGDELNILKNGANYGWPVITFGIDYNGSTISNDTAKVGMEQPIAKWTPSIAVSAIEFVTSEKFSKWKNNLIVTALAFQEIRRLVIDGDRVVEQELLLKGYGRVRDAKFGPDGAMYLLMNGPDEVLRVSPQE